MAGKHSALPDVIRRQLLFPLSYVPVLHGP
jgi:hypothetical protein